MERRRWQSGILALIAIGTLCLHQPFEAHAQSRNDAALAKQFLGTWRLVAWTQRLADGSTTKDPRSVAYLIYSEANRVCFVSMDPNRPANAGSGTDSDGFYAYCGTVEIHAAEGFVLHHVEIDSAPAIVGQTRKRWFRFDGPNRLSLRIDAAELTRPVVENTLVWERVEK